MLAAKVQLLGELEGVEDICEELHGIDHVFSQAVDSSSFLRFANVA
jgi:hypothetical protein